MSFKQGRSVALSLTTWMYGEASSTGPVYLLSNAFWSSTSCTLRCVSGRRFCVEGPFLSFNCRCESSSLLRWCETRHTCAIVERGSDDKGVRCIWEITKNDVRILGNCSMMMKQRYVQSLEKEVFPKDRLFRTSTSMKTCRSTSLFTVTISPQRVHLKDESIQWVDYKIPEYIEIVQNWLRFRSAACFLVSRRIRDWSTVGVWSIQESIMRMTFSQVRRAKWREALEEIKEADDLRTGGDLTKRDGP